MQIKLRKKNEDGITRVETSGKVQEVIINEDLLNPSAESIAVCYRGKNSSGIVEFTPKEIEALYKSVKQRLHLVKGVKKL